MAKERLINYKLSEVSSASIERLFDTISFDHGLYHFDEIRVVGISVTRGLSFPDEEFDEEPEVPTNSEE